MAVLKYQDLTVWQRAMDLAVEIYRLTGCFPPEERYGLTTRFDVQRFQYRRTLPKVKAEERVWNSIDFSELRQGSLQEMETQIILAGRLSFLAPEPLGHLLGLADEVGRLNRGLQKSIVRS